MSTLAKHYGDSEYVEYNVHVSLSPRFIFVNNPKCGCTTTKASLNLWHADWHGEPLVYHSLADIHERSHNRLLSPGQLDTDWDQLLLRDPSYFRFTLLREPLSRVAAAYASKLTWDSDERRDFNRGIGEPLTSDVSFAAFVDAIHQDPVLLNSNEHWRLQTLQVAASLIDYDMICFIETLDRDLSRIRDHLFPGLQRGVFETRKYFPDNRSDSGSVLSGMKPHEISLITAIYEPDFVFYNSALAARQTAAVPPRPSCRN